MDLEVVGRHALLFDDDSMAAFVNSPEALIEWNSLFVDRYDVRHLLPGLPPPRKRRHQDSPLHVDSLESELDAERYLDLSFPSDEQKDTGRDNEDTNNYNAVGFSYGCGDSAEGMSAAGLNGSSFQPPFPVPDSVRQIIPPTEKVHQIIARTATFVSEHGGQSEIVLRVKQGNNPSFGFLMPDHHLHAYFRFLVDHQELLKPNGNGNSQDVKKTDDGHNPAVMDESGALSLLGSVYGSGEDEDDAAEHGAGSLPRANESMENSEISNSREVTHMNLKGSSVKAAGDLPKPLDLKEKVSSGKKAGSLGAVKTRTGKGTKKVTEASDSYYAYSEKSPSPVLSDSKLESPILDPPPELKRVVNKIVEFILKNGKQFEAVLLEQDSKHGRFPFLARSNQYHSYYLKALQSAQEFKSAPKGSFAEKGDSKGLGATEVALSSGNDASSSLELAELPNTDDRKEKFKMILGKSKKDGPDQCSKDPEPNFGITVDATQAAAILQAASRGMRLPKMEIFSKTSLGGSNRGDERQASGDVTSQLSIAQKQSRSEVGEANSSEPYMTDEQRLKADRLRRAKMFVARLKSGSVPLGIETSRGASVERPESAASEFVPEVDNHAGKDIEHSSVSQNLEASHENEKSDMKCFDGEYKERRSKRSYRDRSERKDVDNENDDGSDDEENDHKKPRKKHRSHRSSHHHSKERHRHKKRGSSKDRESRRRHKRMHDSSSDGERCHQITFLKDTESRHRHKRRHDRFSDEEDHHRDSYLKDKELRHRRKDSHDSSSDEESYKHHRGRSRKHTSLEARGDLEEGEISTKLSKANDSATRETSANLSSFCQDGRAPSQPPETATEVSDDLRAKIRAMLLATM